MPSSCPVASWRPPLDQPQPSSAAPALDWDGLRGLALRRLRARLRFTSQETLEDLAQEVIVILFRMSRRETIQNAEALVTTLCHRTCVSHIRRMHGPTGRLEALPEGDSPHELPAPDPAQEVGADMLELFRFVVTEHFRSNDAGCLELANEFFAEHNWATVAERLGLKHNTVIKRWSRCMETVRSIARSGSGPVWEWARAVQIV